MQKRKYIIVTDEIMDKLSERFTLSNVPQGWVYSSPNGMIKKTIERIGINTYGTFSLLSFPTGNIDKYPQIAEDAQDFYDFYQSFDTETFDTDLESKNIYKRGS